MLGLTPAVVFMVVDPSSSLYMVRSFNTVISISANDIARISMHGLFWTSQQSPGGFLRVARACPASGRCAKGAKGIIHPRCSTQSQLQHHQVISGKQEAALPRAQTPTRHSTHPFPPIIAAKALKMRSPSRHINVARKATSYMFWIFFDMFGYVWDNFNMFLYVFNMYIFLVAASAD